MESLKSQLPAIGIGLAAIAIAGYIVFGMDKGDKKKEKKKEKTQSIKVEDEKKEEFIQAEVEEDQRIQHFIPEDEPHPLKLDAIKQWVKKQIGKLLINGELKAPEGVIDQETFVHLSVIIQNAVKTELFEHRKSAQKKRVEWLKVENNWDSLDYLHYLREDVQNYHKDSEKIRADVLQQAKVSVHIHDVSFEAHYADDTKICSSYVRNLKEYLHYYPINSKKVRENAKDIVSQVFTEVTKRFLNDDVFKAEFQYPNQYLESFDYACMDYALWKHDMEEPELRQVLNNDDLIESDKFKEFWKDLAERVNELLDDGENQQREQEALAEQARQAELQQKAIAEKNAQKQTPVTDSITLGESFLMNTQLRQQLENEARESKSEQTEINDIKGILRQASIVGQIQELVEVTVAEPVAEEQKQVTESVAEVVKSEEKIDQQKVAEPALEEPSEVLKETVTEAKSEPVEFIAQQHLEEPEVNQTAVTDIKEESKVEQEQIEVLESKKVEPTISEVQPASVEEQKEEIPAQVVASQDQQTTQAETVQEEVAKPAEESQKQVAKPVEEVQSTVEESKTEVVQASPQVSEAQEETSGEIQKQTAAAETAEIVIKGGKKNNKRGGRKN